MKTFVIKYSDRRYKHLGVQEAHIYADSREDAINEMLSQELGIQNFITFYD